MPSVNTHNRHQYVFLPFPQAIGMDILAVDTGRDPGTVPSPTAEPSAVVLIRNGVLVQRKQGWLWLWWWRTGLAGEAAHARWRHTFARACSMSPVRMQRLGAPCRPTRLLVAPLLDPLPPH